MIDKHLDELASQALGNAFYIQFSELVQHYMKASERLATFDISMLQDLTNVNGIANDLELKRKGFIIKFVTKEYVISSNCLYNALSHEDAMKIYINDVPYFEKYDDGWRLIDP